MIDFCAHVWARTERLRTAMLELPFTVELAAGTLSVQRFSFYLVQDSRYLVGFARALAIAAARAPSEQDVMFFAAAAHEAIAVERGLHSEYFAEYGLTAAEVAAIETSPTCQAYTDYLLAVAASGGYAELIAALLPCFWVYAEIGTAIVARQGAAAANPFRRWIDTYSDEAFEVSVRTARAAVDAAAAAADDATVERMCAAFLRATEYEWMFFDSAYALQAWPTAQLRQ
ncbi:MAG: thiaminase II [Sciscionella sp.]